jgi:hypothetical protein
MKTKYIAMRNGKVLDWSVLYTYAVDKGLTVPPELFMAGAQGLDINELLDQLDKEFELTTLWGKDGSFIKVVE